MLHLTALPADELMQRVLASLKLISHSHLTLLVAEETGEILVVQVPVLSVASPLAVHLTIVKLGVVRDFRCYLERLTRLS